MADEDEDVIFEGSALHSHLANLDLLEEQHPLFLSHQEAATQLAVTLPPAGDGTDAVTCSHLSKSWYHSIKWAFVDWSTGVTQHEETLLWRLAVLLCNKELLSLEHQRHLYYFSKVFQRLVDEPELNECIITTEEGHAVLSRPPATAGGSSSKDTWLTLFTSKLAPVLSVATPLLVVICSYLILPAMDGTGSTAAAAAAATVVLEPALASWRGGVVCAALWWTLPVLVVAGVTTVALAGCRLWQARRYDRCYSALRTLLLTVATLQKSRLPQAFTAASDAMVLGGARASAVTPLTQRVQQQLEQLQQQVHSTLHCTLQLVTRRTGRNQLQEAVGDHWSLTKSLRHDVEAHVSAFARDLLLEAERVYSGRSNSSSPDGNSEKLSPSTKRSVLEVITVACSPLTELLPELLEHIELLNSHVQLLTHCWRYGPEEVDSGHGRQPRTEVQAASDALGLHLMSSLRLLEDTRAQLSSLSADEVQHQHPPLQEDSHELTALQAKFNSVMEKMESLKFEVQLCQSSVDALAEAVEYRRQCALRAAQGESLQLPGGRAVSELPDLHDLPPSSRLQEEPVRAVEPYIAEDEVFEGSTEADAEDCSPHEAPCDVEAEEQSKQLLIARSKRLLNELQPILRMKKEEFALREQIAKRRMENESSSNNPTISSHGQAGLLETVNKAGPTAGEQEQHSPCDEQYDVEVIPAPSVAAACSSLSHTSARQPSADAGCIVLCESSDRTQTSSEESRDTPCVEHSSRKEDEVSSFTADNNSLNENVEGTLSNGFAHKEASELVWPGAVTARHYEGPSLKEAAAAVVAETFVSDPSTEPKEGTAGSPSWDVEQRPVDLQGRLQQMYLSQVRDRCSDADLVEEEGGAALSLGLHSMLASQAVRQASSLGVTMQQVMFGGVGESEETFGDESDEEEKEEDCSSAE